MPVLVFSITVMNTMAKTAWEGEGGFYLTFSVHYPGNPRPEPGRGNEAEVMGEHSLLAFYPWLAHLFS